MALRTLIVAAAALVSVVSALPAYPYGDSRGLRFGNNYAPPLARVRRDLPHSVYSGDHHHYAAPAHDLHHHESVHKPHHYKPGRVGPVYTFVKTDYHGNAKWGVRHRVGSHYAGGYH